MTMTYSPDKPGRITDIHDVLARLGQIKEGACR
ncbi:MAG: hypothetical protein A4E39_01208 [Methanoregulaceae archaeon PtaB.Bin152]|nr:MAG: hypothetical protein A4E39_01208 [Methanoregulaceae archaeon PtaB.Bin152]